MDPLLPTNKTNECYLRNKGLGIFLNAHTPVLLKQTKVKIYLLTGIFTPESRTCDEAWDDIQICERNALEHLRNSGDVVFVLSTIEEHSGSKKKSEEQTKDITDSVISVLATNEKPKGKTKPPAGDIKLGKGKIDGGKKLKGYPHVHMILGVESKDGSFPDENVFTRLLLNVFPDVQTDSTRRGRKSNRVDEAKMIGYVLKNTKYEVSVKKLGRFPSSLHNWSGGEEVEEFFRRVNTYAVYITGTKPALPVSEHARLTSRGGQLILKFVPSTESKVTRKAEGTKLNSTMSLVKAYMEREGLSLFHGMIMQKLPNSFNTWKEWGNCDKLLGKCMDDDHWEDIIKFKSSLITLMSNQYQEVLSTIEMSYMWIEISDAMFHIGTGMLIPKTTEFPCFAFFPIVTKDALLSGSVRTTNLPKNWIQILTNSELTKNLDIFVYFYRLFVPKKHKDKTAVFYGPPNSGKTTLLAPVMELYPNIEIAMIRKANGFELANAIDKQVAIFEEYDGYLDISDLLKFTEGDTKWAVNRKHQDVINTDLVSRPVFISNDGSWMLNPDFLPTLIHNQLKEKVNEENMREDLRVRLKIFYFKTMPKVNIGIKQIIIREETPWIIFLCASYAFDGFEWIEEQNDIKEKLDTYRVVGYTGL
jgi:hypothetical protein